MSEYLFVYSAGEGDGLSEDDGDNDGLKLGLLLGEREGDNDGDRLGDKLGLNEIDTLGESETDAEGDRDGEDQKTLQSFVLYGDPLGYLEPDIYLEKTREDDAYSEKNGC